MRYQPPPNTKGTPDDGNRQDKRSSSNRHSTFDVSPEIPFTPLDPREYETLSSVLADSHVVRDNNGRFMVGTQPRLANIYSGTVRSLRKNGFIGTLYRAYIEHRHLILKPDDVWVAITIAFGGFVNHGNWAEGMKEHFVDCKGKLKLAVASTGTIWSVDWYHLIEKMHEEVEKNTRNDKRQWLVPNFSTTAPVAKTVGQVVIMGMLKQYFEQRFSLNCGLRRVTLEGTVEDWQRLRCKAVNLKSFNIEELTHWAGLLDFILGKFVESYQGEVDKDFWGKMATEEFHGNGSVYLTGWMNIFTPFAPDGSYNLADVKPEEDNWGMEESAMPISAMEIPVTIDDNGQKYETIFYGGHFMSVYNPEDNTLRPHLDWAIIDVTESKKLTWKDKCVDAFSKCLVKVQCRSDRQ